mgnify:CR=1 FL=1
MQRNFLISITSRKRKRAHNTDEEINWDVTAMNKDFAQLEKELAETIFEFSEEARSNHTDKTIKDLDLFEDLKYDSVSLVDLLISLEEKYDVELTEDMSDLIDNLESIGQFMDYILEKIRDVKQVRK